MLYKDDAKTVLPGHITAATKTVAIKYFGEDFDIDAALKKSDKAVILFLKHTKKGEDLKSAVERYKKTIN